LSNNINISFCAFDGYVILCLILREGCQLKVLEKGMVRKIVVPKREETTRLGKTA
jgi:hypothetical protein